MSGRIVVMGSGELAPGLVATHRSGIAASDADRVTVLDTPYGFQENADELTARIRSFFATSLSMPTEVASLRSRGASAGERATALAMVRDARYVFAGPGSPSYALGVWEDVEMGPALRHVVRAGGTVCFASAAALTLGTHTIPVYEIYKVGADPHWLRGLDVLSVAGLGVPVVPHWDNAEGGTHDTSHCYIGSRRFDRLATELASGVLGVDEHTAVVIDLEGETVSAAGRGAVTLRAARSAVIEPGEELGLDAARELLGSPEPPRDEAAGTSTRTGFDVALATGDPDALLEAVLELESATTDDPRARSALQDALVRLVAVAERGLVAREEVVGGFVDGLLAERSRARDEGRWDAADRLRETLDRLGVEVRDTPDGPEWSLR